MSSKNAFVRCLAATALVAMPLVAVGATSPAAAHGGHSHAPVQIRLDSLKGTSASGTATLTPTDDGGLRVKLRTTGMVPGMPHAQHIHGDVSGHRFHCPNDSADVDNSGFISVEEGLKMYGGIHISLTTTGDTTPDSGLAVDRFPVANSDGVVEYDRTLTAAELPKGTLEALSNLHIVQHGVDANGNGMYDLDGLGESTFAKSLGVDGIPQEATDGATCGMVVPSGSVDTGGMSMATDTAAGYRDTFIAVGAVALLAAAGGAYMVARRPARSRN